MKIFFRITIIIFLVTAIALFLITYSLDTIVKKTINTYGSSITGTEVRVKKTKFSINGEGKFESFKVYNPANYSSKSFFKVDSISTQIDIKSIISNTKVINLIQIQKPLIRLEFDKEKNSNLDAILKNVLHYSQKNEKKSSSIKKENSNIKFILKEFSLKDATLEILIPHTEKIITLGLSPIYLKNIGTTGNGVLPNQIVAAIIKKIQQKIANEEISGLLNYKKQVEKAKKRIKDLNPKTKEKLRNKINEKINNLF